jgi:hypothetical protein
MKLGVNAVPIEANQTPKLVFSVININDITVARTCDMTAELMPINLWSSMY